MKVIRITNDKKLLLMDEVIEFPSELEGGRNLIIQDSLIYGKYVVHTSGLEGTAGSHILSEYIEIKPNESYVLSSSQDRVANARYALFDENYQFISGGIRGGYTDNFPFVTTNNSRYVRVSHDYKQSTHLLKLEKGEIPTLWTPAPEDLGYGYFVGIDNFTPMLMNDGRMLIKEIIEGDTYSFSTIEKLYVNELEEGVGLNG